MKDPDLSVVSGGVSVGSGTDANTQMMMMQGMAVPNTPQKVRLTETSRIVLIHTDKLEPDEMLSKVLKILDVAKDSGFQIGPVPARNYYEMQIRAQQGGDASATVSFKLPDTTRFAREPTKPPSTTPRPKRSDWRNYPGPNWDGLSPFTTREWAVPIRRTQRWSGTSTACEPAKKAKTSPSSARTRAT